jgi:hypothetical protein
MPAPLVAQIAFPQLEKLQQIVLTIATGKMQSSLPIFMTKKRGSFSNPIPYLRMEGHVK